MAPLSSSLKEAVPQGNIWTPPPKDVGLILFLELSTHTPENFQALLYSQTPGPLPLMRPHGF
jgi:hypothetical protein